MGGHLSETITKGEENPLGVPPTRGSSQATTAPPAWPLLQVSGGYLQYPTPPKLCDQAQHETANRVNPAEYLQYLTEPGFHRGAGAVPARGVDRAKRRRLGFRVPTHPWEPPTSAGSGFSHSWGCRSRVLPGSVAPVGDTRVYGFCCSFPPTRSVIGSGSSGVSCAVCGGGGGGLPRAP